MKPRGGLTPVSELSFNRAKRPLELTAGAHNTYSLLDLEMF